MVTIGNVKWDGEDLDKGLKLVDPSICRECRLLPHLKVITVICEFL